ncbi:hypothetical protein C0Z01_14175 [Photobacterium kishitanii]|uniref:major capsid protein P2 n=1 Tax=Photobacterium kishitanii TaxID=318456 RepID=UPI0007EF8EC8|nr:major capsid protein P2 [Photobacterium kishitanii]OBU24957.1 hypothetical protein AYY22_21020 [Photobacterium kishitanii]PSW68703.1 hypothetical protein C0Z01_14175 [Photobacterium kishitanii]
MSRKIVKLPTIQNVVAGGTSVINLKLGLTYDKIEVRYSGATSDQIKNIKLMLNGREVQYFESAKQLDAINKYYNRNIEAGRFVIWFVRPEMTEVVEQRVTALGTADLVTATLEFDIDSSVDTTKLKACAYAVQSDASNAGMITKVKRFPVTFAVGGVQDIADIPKPNTAMIAAIHLFTQVAGNIKQIAVEVDSVNAIDQVDVDVLAENQKDRGRVPDSNECVVCDWMLEGELSEAMQLNVQDFRLKPEIANAGGVVMMIEYIDVALGGI